MYLVESSLQLAGTDLGHFLSCRHCTALDMEVAQGLREKPYRFDPFIKALTERGDAHVERRRRAI